MALSRGRGFFMYWMGVYYSNTTSLLTVPSLYLMTYTPLVGFKNMLLSLVLWSVELKLKQDVYSRHLGRGFAERTVGLQN